VASLEDAARMLAGLGRRHFLTVGRQGVSAFAGVADAWFLVRCIEPPGEPAPSQMELVLDRGPFSLESEIALMRDRRVDTVITKNSGGPATAAKLSAARELALPVVMVRRPAAPDVPEVADVQSALSWVAAWVTERVTPPGSPWR
jgi:precorrin-6A/cobalt-precorrin-6A reductase